MTDLTADWAEVSELMSGFLAVTQEELSDVSTRLQKNLEEAPENIAVQLREMVSKSDNCTTAFLESLTSKQLGPRLNRNSAALIASSFSLPALLLDNLFSKTTQKSETLIVESLNQFQDVTQKTEVYGERASYGIPQRKLPVWMDIGIGRVEIAPGGSSDIHDHPGTEFAVVLQGEAELRLATSGVCLPIKKNDFVHFRSDMPHQIANTGKKHKAVLLIIRCFQLASRSMRSQAMQILQNTIDALKSLSSKKKNKEKSDATRGESTGAGKSGRRKPELDLLNLFHSLSSRATTDQLKQRNEVPAEVVDRFGFGLMLDRIKGTRSLGEMARQGNGKFKSATLWQIHHGERVVRLNELSPLADQYGLEPMLLYSFMFPTEPAIVVGRLDDLQTVPSNLTGGGVTYRVAGCNLALSDLEIVHVTLSGRSSTKPNGHSGFEIVMPLGNARIEVRLDGERSEIVSGRKKEYAHFRSDVEHQIINRETSEATILVVRFRG